MPIYEYACRECGHEFERLVKMSAEPPPCPECGAEVRKKVSASAFILKGGGWYKDGYGLKPSSSGSDKGDSSKGDSSKGDSSKGDSSKGSDTSSKAKAVNKAASSSSSSGGSES